MNSEELKNKLDSKEDFILIDCREQYEWDEGRIGKAVFMPMSDFLEKCKDLKDKEATIVVQCRSGHRSLNVCNYLFSEGYTTLYNLEDGILGWQQHGYPIVTEEL